MKDELEIEEGRIGPGAYEPDPNVVKRRTDIYGAKMAPLNEYNAKEQFTDLAKRDATDFNLDPLYDFVKKRAPGTVIKGPVHLEGPPNVPTDQLIPDRWEFYDVNLEAYKPNTEIGAKFADTDFNKFKLKEHEKDMLRRYLQMQHRVPEPGYYDPIFKLMDEGVAIPDFGRYLERSRLLTREEVMNMEIEGDNLVLDPEKPQKKLPNLVNYDKMDGRPEKVVDEYTDELVIDKNYNQVEKKVINLVDMKRASEKKNISADPIPGEIDDEYVELDINYAAVEKKIINLVNYKKDQGKIKLREEEMQEDYNDEILVNPNIDATRENKNKTTVVMRPPTSRKINPNDGAAANMEEVGGNTDVTEARIDINKAIESVKPKAPGVSLGKTTGRQNSMKDRKVPKKPPPVESKNGSNAGSKAVSNAGSNTGPKMNPKPDKSITAPKKTLPPGKNLKK